MTLPLSLALVIEGLGDIELHELTTCAHAIFPHVTVLREAAARGAEIHVAEWCAPELDILQMDRRIHGAEDLARRNGKSTLILKLRGCDLPEAPRVVAQILTRYQRLCFGPGLLQDELMKQIFTAHFKLFDLEKPLVRADYDHALDVLQWVCRLWPSATVQLQVAALFHDVERLLSEADRRIEHLASDYPRFKDAHAERGAEIVRTELCEALPEEELERACALIQDHERITSSFPLRLLNDADGLSFFSLNSAGFLAYFGEAHTRMKVRYTMLRMQPEARAYVPTFRLPKRIRGYVDEVLEELKAPKRALVTLGHA